MDEHEYAGFWIRVAAALIDTVCILVIIVPIIYTIYGESMMESDAMFMGFWDVLFSYILPMVAVVAFWVKKSATPGKLITKLSIIDAKTGGKPSTKQFIGRYLSYYLSGIPLLLGYVWVGFDKRKQGWHDKLAGTLVVYNR